MAAPADPSSLPEPASTLTAGGGDALLIAGSTNYNANDAALLAILTEWNSSEELRHADRRTSWGRATIRWPKTGCYYLNASTVHSNGQINHHCRRGGGSWRHDVQNNRATSSRQKDGLGGNR